MHEVVLARIGAVVPVEAGVHAAELGQAHRHVAVVEHDRDAEALAQRGRDAAEVRHRHGEDDDRVGPLALDEPLEVPAPARRHPAPDHLARHPVAEPVVRVVLGAAEVRVALQPRASVARAGERLALEVGRVRRASATRATRPAARGRARRRDRRPPRTGPSRAATRRACSRSGSRGRPPRRRRASWARACARIVAGRRYVVVKGVI